MDSEPERILAGIGWAEKSGQGFSYQLSDIRRRRPHVALGWDRKCKSVRVKECKRMGCRVESGGDELRRVERRVHGVKNAEGAERRDPRNTERKCLCHRCQSGDWRFGVRREKFRSSGGVGDWLPRSLRCATRRAKRRHAGKCRVAPVGMTGKSGERGKRRSESQDAVVEILQRSSSDRLRMTNCLRRAI